MTAKIECLSCHHRIDAEARLCPYCGADPRTGARFDPKPLLEKHFPKRAALSGAEAVLEFFRARQGIVVTAIVAVIFLALVGLHRFITERNARQVSDVPAVPLTEVADLSHRAVQTEQLPIPQLEFQYAGAPQMIRAALVEPGAVSPPTPPQLDADHPVLQRFLYERPRTQTPPPESLLQPDEELSPAEPQSSTAAPVEPEAPESESEPSESLTTTTDTSTPQ